MMRPAVLCVGLLSLNVPLNVQADNLSDTLVARLQTTYIHQKKPGFAASEIPPGNRVAGQEALNITNHREPRSYTFTTTAYLGLRPWAGSEIFYNPEMSMGQPMSQLEQGLGGLGGLSNGENQKNGGPNPIFYTARFFLRHTFNLGAATETVEPELNSFAGKVAPNRLVVTVGKLSVTDIFDDNAVAHDPRTQFMNWSLMANEAYDYAADSRGYTKGIAIEYFSPTWEFRYGRFMMPAESNGQRLDHALFKRYGEQVEITHNHRWWGQPGSLRALVFHNRAITGAYRDAVAFSRPADLAPVRRLQDKNGFSLNMDQQLGEQLTVFARAGRSDGKTETYAFGEVDRSVSLGASLKGGSWGRAEDMVGLAAVRNDLSGDHRRFLAAGGTGVFVGGFYQNRYAPEQIVEAYYSAKLAHGTWFSLDYQRIHNPAYNPDRGPINIYGARLHIELGL